MASSGMGWLVSTFIEDYPLEGLRGADYNPRRIEGEALEALRRSLDTLGVCKPIIVSGDLIIAGHQRTRSLRALGRKTAPAIVLGRVTEGDEIRFNQLHNGTDFDCGDELAHAGRSAGEPFRFEMVPAAACSGNMRAKLANVRAEICKLMTRYGNWGGCVATMSGAVIHAGQYLLACKALNFPVRVYRIPDEMEGEARQLLGRTYGVFSYDHLERKTYIQTYAQMMRLRDGPSGRALASSLYENRVLPGLKRGERILDFGCGQGDYVKALGRTGHRIFGIEFFFREGSQIDGAAVHRMIDAAAADIERHGLFDVVVCDSVLNSVDSLQAEADVLTCVNALCRPGGRIYFSGRQREKIESQDRSTQVAESTRYVEFMDEHGFTALYRHGNWFYQKFHARAAAEALGRRYIGNGAAYQTASSTAWSVAGTKAVELDRADVEASIAREFDLIWPGGRSVGRAQRMLQAWSSAHSAARQTASIGTS